MSQVDEHQTSRPIRMIARFLEPIESHPPHPATTRLTLRRLRPDDAADLFRTVGDPDVMRYWAPGPDATVDATAQRITEIDHHWTTHGFGDWAVLENATGALVGFAGLHHIAEMAEVNVGYAFEKSRWGLGYGTEVCRATIAHGLDRLALPEIVAVIAPQNVASIRVAEKCGLTFWKHFVWSGRDRVAYRITRAVQATGVADPANPT
jgi:[ribosomal protein S5]-alanine N-acetyltransferase